MPIWQRFIALTVFVAAVHAAALWAVHAYKLPTSLDNQAPALQTRAIEPPKLSEPQQLSAPAATAATALTPLAPVNPKIAAPSAVALLKPAAQPAPATTAPLLIGKLPSLAPPAVTGSYAPAPIASPAAPSIAPATASAANSPASAAPAAGNKPIEQGVQLPSADADHDDTQYRHPLPAISTRLGETGRVMVTVQVGLSGKPLQVLVAKSSGFDRLDDNAVKTVMRWRFRPGIKNGVPEVMWVEQSVRYDPPKE